MSKRTMLLTAIVACAALATAGCVAEEEPTTPPPPEVLDAEEAFYVAVDWLRGTYGDSAPEDGLSWVVEDVQVLGPDGQPLLGAAETRITSDDWVADVTWAVVAPEYLQYGIVLTSPTLGRFWEGSVKAIGGQVLEEIPLQAMTMDLAEEVAWAFVKASPTYMASGMTGTLVLVDSDVLRCPFCWSFVFEFESRHSGYGDTSDQVVLQVITPHRAVIAVQAMEVTEAVMDGKWDMLAQSYVIMTEEAAEEMAGIFVRSSPTFVFDGILGTLELAETLQPDMENAWAFVFTFQSAHAGYGDRTGQVLAEVITAHEAHVTVQNGEVVSASMDGQWDMLAQKMVP